jgi:hypothetical protein
LWEKGIYADGTISWEDCMKLLKRGLIYTEGTKEKMGLRRLHSKIKRPSSKEVFSWGEWWEI